MLNKIRVILVDDHVIVRSGIRRLLENSGQIEVVAEAENGEQAYQLYSEHMPDVLIMDMSMPGLSGLETMRRIMARKPFAKVIIFSMYANTAFATHALAAGARSFVAKSGMPEDLIKAVYEVAADKNYVSPEIAQKIAVQSMSDSDNPIHRLSAREFEVFRLLAEGKSVEEISTMLFIGQKTVSNYQTSLKQKLGINNAVELVRLAIRYDVISY